MEPLSPNANDYLCGCFCINPVLRLFHVQCELAETFVVHVKLTIFLIFAMLPCLSIETFMFLNSNKRKKTEKWSCSCYSIQNVMFLQFKERRRNIVFIYFISPLYVFFTSPNLLLFLLEVVTLAPDDVSGQPSDTEGNTMVLKA